MEGGISQKRGDEKEGKKDHRRKMNFY